MTRFVRLKSSNPHVPDPYVNPAQVTHVVSLGAEGVDLVNVHFITNGDKQHCVVVAGPVEDVVAELQR